ncbi:MAG: oligosaccharide flippase family protein [Planctomycetales bacterium]|nr:oligosaccharide flippase family protein [Planctomycetales bacterium]
MASSPSTSQSRGGNAPAGPGEASAPSIGDSLAHGMMIALILAVFQRLSGVVRSFILCGVLDDEQLGLWSLAQSIIFSLAPLSVLGTTSTLRRYVEHYRLRGELGGFLRVTLGTAASLTLVGAVVLMIAAPVWSRVFFREAGLEWLVIWMAVGTVAIVMFNTLQDLTESLRLIRTSSWMRLLHSVGFTILGALFVIVIRADVVWVAVAFLIASVIASVPAIPALRGMRAQGVMGSLATQPTGVWRKIWRYAGWNCVISVISNLFELSDRYMLQMLGGVDVHEAHALVGQYHASRMIPVLLIGVAQMLTNMLLPFLVAHWERNERSEVVRMLNLTIKTLAIAMTFGGAAILTLAPLLYSILFNDRYDAGLSVLPMAMTYCIWFSLYTIGEDYLWCCEKGGWATGTLLIAVIANFVLNALFIPVMGLHGATLATLLGNGIAWGGLLLVSRRFGWNFSLSMALLSLLPLVLSLGVLPSLAACAAVMVLLAKGKLFDANERERLAEQWNKVRAKFSRAS